jgi:hypothetical protein
MYYDWSEMENILNDIKELLEILDRTEVSISGTVFHPTTINTCRVMDGEKLDRILKNLKLVVGTDKWKNDLMVKIMEIVYVLDNQNKIELVENWKESAKQRYMSDVAFKYRVNMAFAYLTGENSEN